MLQEKQLQKVLPGHFFVAGMNTYFPTSFWWSLSVLLSYWEEIFPFLWNFATIAVLLEHALKLSVGGKITIFTSHQVKQFLNGKSDLWMSYQRILRYQVVLMENPGLTISPCEVLNPATLLLTLEGSLPFHSCLEMLDHWKKTRRGIVRRSSDKSLRKSGTLMETALSWMKNKSQICSSHQFWDHRS